MKRPASACEARLREAVRTMDREGGRQHGVASGTERARAMEGFLSRGPSPALEPWAQALCQLAQCGHNLRNALFYKMNVTFFQNVHYP